MSVRNAKTKDRKGSPPHSHQDGQLWLAISGVIVAEISGGTWVLPPGSLGWIPPGTTHSAKAYGSSISGWVVYLRKDLSAFLPDKIALFNLTPLTKALFERIVSWRNAQARFGDQQKRLFLVLFDELNASSVDPLFLPMPQSKVLSDLAIALIADPSSKRTLEQWGHLMGLSTRGLTRHFRRETGMSLVQWRTLARIKRALEMLADGTPVTTISMDLGYNSVSNFAAVFKRIVGLTPTQYRHSRAEALNHGLG